MNLDIAQIKKLAANRKISFDSSDQRGWICPHCKKTLSSETYFLNHHCKKKERAELIQGVVGKRAYVIYATWLQKNKFSVPTISTFIDSRYFSAFIKFAEFASKVGLTSVDVYIDTMLELDYPPAMWRRNEAYIAYLDKIDNLDLTTLLDNSLSSLIKLLEKYEIENDNFDELFVHLGHKKLTRLFIKRELSPFLFFVSKKLKTFIESDKHEREEFIKATQLNAWGLRLRAIPNISDTIQNFKKQLKEIGL